MLQHAPRRPKTPAPARHRPNFDRRVAYPLETGGRGDLKELIRLTKTGRDIRVQPPLVAQRLPGYRAIYGDAVGVAGLKAG